MSTNDLAESLKDCTIFVDRSSGKAVSAIFVELGIRFELHDDIYPQQDTLDVEWLTDCGESGKIVLSTNHHIKHNRVERDALLKAGVGAFFFTTGDWSTVEKLDALRQALPRMANIILEDQRPFIARIYKDGRVEKWINHKGKELPIRGRAKAKNKL